MQSGSTTTSSSVLNGSRFNYCHKAFHHSSLCLKVFLSFFALQFKNEMQIPSKGKQYKSAFSPDKHSLVLHGCIYSCLWLKKINPIKIEGVKPSLLVQDTPPKPCGKWKIDSSIVWLMNFCLDMRWSWTFLSAVIMLSSWPTPKDNNHLLYLSLTPPMKGKPVSFTELNKIQVFQYIFHIPW